LFAAGIAAKIAWIYYKNLDLDIDQLYLDYSDDEDNQQNNDYLLDQDYDNDDAPQHGYPQIQGYANGGRRRQNAYPQGNGYGNDNNPRHDYLQAPQGYDDNGQQNAYPQAYGEGDEYNYPPVYQDS
jgi:hypothetical protein